MAFSGHSRNKLERIKNFWLSQSPIAFFNYRRYHYLLFDGTYFHKDGCLLVLMDVPSQTVIFNAYVDKEGYYSVYPFLSRLKEQGLNPHALTVDGHHTVLRAFKEVWPGLRIQRCLCHIQREGLRWLRTFPKTQAGCDLRVILGGLHRIKSVRDRSRFLESFAQWERTHETFVRSLSSASVAFKDLKRTRSLIRHATPDMFHYLEDPKIVNTTNLLEGFFSRLKADFRRHRGLSETHKRDYLKWYCYFKNQ